MDNQFIRSVKENKRLIAILLIALFLRFFHLGYQSVWMDEIYTLNVSNPNASFATLISEVNLREGFPYLYFILMKLMFTTFGYVPEVARAFSAIMGVASVYMLYRLGKQLFSKNVGLIAATIITFSEYCIYISQDARPYTFYFFAVILSFYTLVNFVRNPSFRNGIMYGLAAALLLNTNFFSFINLLSQAAIILFFIAKSPKESRASFIKHSGLAGIIAIMLFIVNYRILAKLLEFKSAWIPAPTNESMTLIFKEFLGNSEMTLFFFVPLFLYFLIDLFNTKPTRTQMEILGNKKVFSFLILFPWTVVYVLVVFLKSHTDTSLMISRYFISILPVFFLVFAAGINLIRNAILRYCVLGFLLLFMLANTVAVKKYYTVPSKTQFREAASFVLSNNTKDEPVYTSLKYWFDYFFINGNKKYTVIEKPSLDAVIVEMAQDSSKIRSFWYVDAHLRPFALSEASEKFVAEHFYVENNFDGYDAWGRHYILLKDAPSVDLSKFTELKPVNGDVFRSSVETFENANNNIKAAGWAYFENESAEKSRIELVLIKEGKVFPLQTQKVNRPDVTSYFNLKYNADNSGFSISSDISTLQAGRYQLAIYLINPNANKEGLILTEHFVDKQ